MKQTTKDVMVRRKTSNSGIFQQVCIFILGANRCVKYFGYNEKQVIETQCKHCFEVTYPMPLEYFYTKNGLIHTKDTMIILVDTRYLGV